MQRALKLAAKLVCAFGVVLLFSTAAFAATSFVDVDETTPHSEHIYWLADQGISEGWVEPDGTRTYRPMDTVKRCDMAAFLYRLAGSPDYTPTEEDKQRFVDVGESTPHAKEVWWLARTGISTGWDDGTFRPMGEVVRQDMAAFLRRMARYLNRFDAEVWQPSSMEERRVFSDVSDSTPHSEDIYWLAHSGVSTGYSDGTFQGMRPVYRQDMAAFLRRVFELSEAAYENPNTDHVHSWSTFSWWNIKNGYACNGCAQDVTGWDNMYACCGGWHTHTWYLKPSSYTCTVCGVKKHEHEWYYHEPTYQGGTDEIMDPEWWECTYCGAQSWDGDAALPVEVTSKGFKRGEINLWTTPYDFAADEANEWVIVNKWREDAEAPSVQSVKVTGYCSLSPGDKASLKVTITPASSAGLDDVSWSSDNSEVVSVDGSGNITAHTVGTATITAECQGHKDTHFVRVTENNIGSVKGARLYVGEQLADGGVLALETGSRYEMYVETDPSEAVYQVKYVIENETIYPSPSYPWLFGIDVSGSSSLGNLSEYSWENGPDFTDPTSEISTGKPCTATIVATITDANGVETVLKQDVVVG